MVPTIIHGHDFNIIFGSSKVLKIKNIKENDFFLVRFYYRKYEENKI